jgi:hypothetical protein
MNSTSRMTLLAAAVALGLGAGSVRAASVTLPLNGSIHTGDDIENYYNGGTDSTGQGPGPDLGIGFSANAIAQSAGDSESTGDGKFENNPSGQSQVLAFAFSNSTGSYINYATGFSSISFNYSFSNNTNPDATENAYIYSGLNGTGTLLDTLSLTPAGTTVACTKTGDAYCTWSLASTGSVNLGTAESVLFGTTPTTATTGAGSPVLLTEVDGVTLTPVPLPAALWLLLSGTASLFGFARRRAA